MDPFEAVRDARDRELVVEFAYDKKMRVFSPFQLDNASVIGWDHGRDEIRRYRFDKMANIRFNTDEEYVRPQ